MHQMDDNLLFPVQCPKLITSDLVLSYTAEVGVKSRRHNGEVVAMSLKPIEDGKKADNNSSAEISVIIDG